MMRYKGYLGVLEVDDEAGIIAGRVVGLRDVITFQGKSVSEARKAFRESVDDYLEWAAAEGREPERSYNGKILLRVEPTVHRELMMLAEARAVSLNTLLADTLTGLVTSERTPAPGSET